MKGFIPLTIGAIWTLFGLVVAALGGSDSEIWMPLLISNIWMAVWYLDSPKG